MPGSNEYNLAFGLSPEEVEFCALEMPVTVFPNFNMERLQCINGEYGPFFPSVPAKVPLWLAIQLRKRQKCTIQPPDWMTVDNLRQHIENEQREPETFVEIPFHYIEIAKVLFQHAPSDIPKIDEIRSLVQEVQDLREKKTMIGLKALTVDSGTVTLPNLSWMEINVMRDFLCSVLDQFHIVRKARDKLPPRPANFAARGGGGFGSTQDTYSQSSSGAGGNRYGASSQSSSLGKRK